MERHIPMTPEFYQLFLAALTAAEHDESAYEIHTKEAIEEALVQLDAPDDLSGEEPAFAADVLRWNKENKVLLNAMLLLLDGDKKYLLCKVYVGPDGMEWFQDIPIMGYVNQGEAQRHQSYLEYVDGVNCANEVLEDNQREKED
jgi:hypothetical protein